MNQPVNAFEYAPQILSSLPKGILLTSKAGEQENTMVIGWGHLGILWGKPVFITYVRESRYTKQLLDQNPEFTINVPLEKVDPKIISVCGSKSGRDLDKFAECGLTKVPAQSVSVPAIQELPLTLECKVIYTQRQVREDIPESVLERMYKPTESDPEGDIHTAYYGEIVNAYILQ